MSRSHLVALAAALCVASASPAFAQDDAESSQEQAQQAAEKFREGLELFEDSPDQALPLFREAHSLSGSPNARLMVARCLIKLGKKAEAYAELELVLRDAGEREEPKYQRTADSAREEMTALHSQLGKLTVTLTKTPPGLMVKLDGSEIDAEDLAEPMILEPGEHELVASADGMETITKKVSIQGGHAKTVKLALEPPKPKKAKPAPAPREEPEPEPEPEAATSGFDLRTAGFIVAGVGVVGLGVFATTGLMAKSKYDSVDSACDGERCETNKHNDDIDSGKKLQTVANVSLFVGGAAILAGSAMIVFGGPSAEQPPVAAAVLPGGGFVSYEGRF